MLLLTMTLMIMTVRSQLSALDPEHAIAPAHRLHNQLLNTVAEQAALEDAMDLLKDALEQRKITAHYFVSSMRNAAAKQFEHKVLADSIAKALETAAGGSPATAPGRAESAPRLPAAASASAGPYGAPQQPAYLMASGPRH